ncbi:MAG: hypothetical protein PHO14_04540 [Kiritimatiellae bacterium]|nr:hypothetical protein [Kiritimatiellia bacterium]MDD4341487.1 hypothetical protein [Kiritimatiellia bacterium]
MRLLRPPALGPLAAAVAFSLLALGLGACDIGSTDSTSAVVSNDGGSIYDFSGLYASVSNSTETNNGANTLVYPSNRQSGKMLTWLRLLQYGSVLEGYDNAGMNWEGSISSLSGSTAQFNLQGRTTTGAAVEITGALRYADQSSTMDATWIEPGFAGSIFARATVSPAITNTPVGDVTIDPQSATLSSTTDPITFTATGGSGNYSWTHNSSCGKLSATTGSQIQYEFVSTGNDTLTVSSGGKTASATITCQ